MITFLSFISDLGQKQAKFFLDAFFSLESASAGWQGSKKAFGPSAIQALVALQPPWASKAEKSTILRHSLFFFLLHKTSSLCQTFRAFGLRQKTIHNSLRIAVVSSYFLQIWVDAKLRTLKCHLAQSLGVPSSQWMVWCQNFL